MESVLLSARCTANTATVFWNKPENANADTVYEVSLDGGHSVHTIRDTLYIHRIDTQY